MTKATQTHNVASLADAIALLAEPHSAASFESESHIYAFSLRSLGPAAYGHAAKTVHLNKATGWLSVTE